MNQQHPPDFLTLPNTSAERLGFRIPTRSSSLPSSSLQSRSHSGYLKPKGSRSRTGRRIRNASLDTIASLDATRDQVSKCLRTLSLSNRASGEIEVGTRRAHGRTSEIQRGTEDSESETSSDDMVRSNTEAGDGDSSDADPSYVPQTRSFGLPWRPSETRDDESERTDPVPRTESVGVPWGSSQADDGDSINTNPVPKTRLFGRPWRPSEAGDDEITYANPIPQARSFGRPWRPSGQRHLPYSHPQPPIERVLSKGKQAGHNFRAFWNAARVGNKDAADLRHHHANRVRDSGETMTDSRPESPAFAWHLLDPSYDAESRSVKSGSMSQSGGQSQSQSYYSHGGSSQSQSHTRPPIPPIPDDIPASSKSLFPIPTPSTTTGSRSPRSFTIPTPSDPVPTTLTSPTSPPTSPKSFTVMRFPDPPTHEGAGSGDRLYILENATPPDEGRGGDDDAYLRLNVIHEERASHASNDAWEEINDAEDDADQYEQDRNMEKNEGKRKQKKQERPVVERAVKSAMSERSFIDEDDDTTKPSRPSTRSTTPISHIRSQISPVLRPLGSTKRTPSVRRERYSPILAAIDTEPEPVPPRVPSKKQTRPQTQRKPRPDGKAFRVPEAMGAKLMSGYEGMGWE